MEILPNIWIGSHKDALNNKFIKNNHIQVIINCTKTIPFSKLQNIKKIRIPVNDSLKDEDIELLYQYFDKTNKILNQTFSSLTPVLVHCYAGKQRSATVIAAFIMEVTKLDKLDIIAMIKSKKNNCFTPCINFSKSLDKFKNDLLKKNNLI